MKILLSFSPLSEVMVSLLIERGADLDRKMLCGFRDLFFFEMDRNKNLPFKLVFIFLNRSLSSKFF
jgi:hypothetical protein